MMQDITTTSILSLFDTNKAQRASFVHALITELQEGNRDVIKVHKQVKAMVEICEAITKDKQYRDLLLDEAAKHGKTFSAHNAEFQIKAAPGKYDYSVCNDPLLAGLEAAVEAAKDALKARQEMLKAIPAKGIEVLVGDELLTMYPPGKVPGEDLVTVKLK